MWCCARKILANMNDPCLLEIPPEFESYLTIRMMCTIIISKISSWAKAIVVKFIFELQHLSPMHMPELIWANFRKRIVKFWRFWHFLTFKWCNVANNILYCTRTRKKRLFNKKSFRRLSLVRDQSWVEFWEKENHKSQKRLHGSPPKMMSNLLLILLHYFNALLFLSCLLESRRVDEKVSK